MSGVEAKITSGSMMVSAEKAKQYIEGAYSTPAASATDSPVALFADNIHGVDSENLIEYNFELRFVSDLILTDEDYDAIGEGNMGILMTVYPPETFRSNDETGYNAYNPIQEFSTNYPYITAVVPNPDETYTDFSDCDRIMFIEHDSSEKNALKTKLGMGELDTSTANITSETMDTIITQLADQLYNTTTTNDYIAKTIRIPRLTARDFLQEGDEAGTTSTAPVSAASTTAGGSTTSGGGY